MINTFCRWSVIGTRADDHVGCNILTVEVSEDFGNTVEQLLILTVRYTEIEEVTREAAPVNAVTATELNSVVDLDGESAENNTEYQLLSSC